MRLAKIRIELQGLFELLYHFLRPPFLHQRVSEVVADDTAIGILLQRGPVQGDLVAVAAVLPPGQ